VKGILNKRVAVAAFLVAGFVALLVTSNTPLLARGGIKAIQKEFIELNKKVSPSVVAVNVGEQTWSGFFIGDDGLVLTTGDITLKPDRSQFGAAAPDRVDLASIKPSVLLASGKSYEAKVLGHDPYNNVVLLKVDSTDKFAGIKLGSSSNIEAGQFVATIGNVYASINNDNQSSFSAGTVTGFFRLTGTRAYKGNLVETEASVNPGSEGCPMVNLKGEVVAMACKHYAHSRFQGTGVPVDQIKLVLDDLKQGNKILSGYFGATFEDTIIEEVDEHSPAQEAGLLPGDSIAEIDGVLIKNDDDIKTMLGNTPAGTTTDIFVRRGNEEILLSVTYGKGVEGKEIKPPPLPGGPGPKPWVGRGHPYLGITVQEKDGKLTITEMASDSPAQKAGLRPGWIILELNGEKAGSLASFEAKFAKLRPGQQIKLRVQREDGWKKTFTITLGGKTGKSF